MILTWTKYHGNLLKDSSWSMLSLVKFFTSLETEKILKIPNGTFLKITRYIPIVQHYLNLLATALPLFAVQILLRINESDATQKEEAIVLMNDRTLNTPQNATSPYFHYVHIFFSKWNKSTKREDSKWRKIRHNQLAGALARPVLDAPSHLKKEMCQNFIYVHWSRTPCLIRVSCASSSL